MSFIEIFLTAISLSLDAVAIAAAAAALHHISFRDALKIAFFFGGFQFGMPLLGWLMGVNVSSYVVTYGHIIGFTLLLGVGLKMLYEALRKDDVEDEVREQHLTETSTLTIMAIATSIDALVVGITFSFIEVDVPLAVIVIGTVTFALSLAAIQFGKLIQRYIGSKVELLGGAVLIALAFKMLIV